MYKVIKNIDKEYVSTGGIKMTVPKECEYSVYFIKDGRSIPVFNVNDYFQDPKGIAEGMCKLLNQGKIVLNLDI